MEGSVEQVYSWVATAIKLLRKAMATVGRDVLHLI
jgi:hypothetical protein